MILHPPFQISPRLLPALRIGDAWLSLDRVDHGSGREGRDVAEFILDLPDGTDYRDDNLQSGCQGFEGAVEVFETFLSFLAACAESIRYGEHHGEPGDNESLFPPHVGAWALENCNEIECLMCDLTEPDGSGRWLTGLIED